MRKPWASPAVPSSGTPALETTCLPKSKCKSLRVSVLRRGLDTLYAARVACRCVWRISGVLFRGSLASWGSALCFHGLCNSPLKRLRIFIGLFQRCSRTDGPRGSIAGSICLNQGIFPLSRHRADPPANPFSGSAASQSLLSLVLERQFPQG